MGGKWARNQENQGIQKNTFRNRKDSIPNQENQEWDTLAVQESFLHQGPPEIEKIRKSKKTHLEINKSQSQIQKIRNGTPRIARMILLEKLRWVGSGPEIKKIKESNKTHVKIKKSQSQIKKSRNGTPLTARRTLMEERFLDSQGVPCLILLIWD